MAQKSPLRLLLPGVKAFSVCYGVRFTLYGLAFREKRGFFAWFGPGDAVQPPRLLAFSPTKGAKALYLSLSAWRKASHHAALPAAMSAATVSLTATLSVATAVSPSRTGPLTALVSVCLAAAASPLTMPAAAATLAASLAMSGPRRRAAFALCLSAVAMPMTVLLFFSALCPLSCRSAATVRLRLHSLCLFRVLRFHDRLLFEIYFIMVFVKSRAAARRACMPQCALA